MITFPYFFKLSFRNISRCVFKILLKENRALESKKIPSWQSPVWILCGSALQHKLLQTTAAQARDHWVATRSPFKNWELVLQFYVLVQVPKKGLHGLLERAKGCWQEKKSIKTSRALPGWVYARSFEIRDYLKSGFMAWAQAPALSLYTQGICCSLMGCGSAHLSSEKEVRGINSAWASSPAWGSSNLHFLC